MNEFVVVVDADPLSRRQLEICAALKPDLKGGIDCTLQENSFADICFSVKEFPAFCHAPTNRCVYGLRTTKEHFEDLANHLG